MNSITRYVLRQLVLGMVLVTVGLTCIIWLTQSLRFVELIVNRGLTAATFLHLTSLLLPNFLTVILPVALFTVVMRAVGMSQMATARPALILALVVVALGYLLNLSLLPASYRMFRELQWDIRYNYSHILLQEGTFNSVSKDITVYVRERSSDGQLHGILVHDARHPERPSTIMAARGALVEADGQARVVMFEGNRQEVDRKTNKFSVLYFDRYTVELESTPRPDVVRYREPRERELDELFAIDGDALLNVKEYGKFIVEGHKRLVAPAYALALTLIALACIISGGITRRGQTRRVVAAAALAILFQGATMGLENLAARSLALVPLMYLLPLIVVGLAWLAMMQAAARRPLAIRAHITTTAESWRGVGG